MLSVGIYVYRILNRARTIIISVMIIITLIMDVFLIFVNASITKEGEILLSF